MANQSVLELAVGTGKWDAGLKKAQQSLNSFISASGGFERMLEKDNEKVSQFVQMMGKIDSTATTAKGKMNDYKRTLEQLTEQYNQMSDAQKNSIGQDYLKTIESIKSKYQEAKAQVESFNKSLGESGTTMNGTGGVLDQLASKFTVNIDALKLFDLGLKGAKAALDVAKDAFFASEANVDEWGRTIKGAEGLYEGFLNALNTSTRHRIIACIHNRHLPWFQMTLVDGHLILTSTKIKNNIRVAQIIISKPLLDIFLTITSTYNELVMSIVGILFHDMPKNGHTAYLNHRFGFENGFLRNTGTKAAG